MENAHDKGVLGGCSEAFFAISIATISASEKKYLRRKAVETTTSGSLQCDGSLFLLQQYEALLQQASVACEFDVGVGRIRSFC